MTFLGNTALLEMPAVGFLCSRTTGSSAILPSLDWAVEHARGSQPVISTFHSELEQSVLKLLVSGTCPIVMVLGRSLYRNIPPQLQPLLAVGRLLLVSLADTPRISLATALASNQYVCRHAASLTFGFLAPQSSLYTLYQEQLALHKPVTLLSAAGI